MQAVHTIIDQELENVRGFCSLSKAHALIDLVETNKIRHFVELGVFGGRSLFPVALAIKVLHDSDKLPVSVVGVDAWSITAALEGVPDKARDEYRDSYWSNIDYGLVMRETQQLMDRHNLSRIVKLVKASSRDYYLNVADQSLDMLHQDSNHSELISRSEVALYHNKVRPGGFWIFDDTDWKSTEPAQKDLQSHGYVCIKDFSSWKIYQRLAQ